MEKLLPKGWVISNIEESVAILDNMRKPVSATERTKRSGDIPYYGATGLAGYIDDYLFDEELVLIGEDGAPFFDKTKNVAFIITGKSWVNNHAHVLKAKNNTVNKFILHYLNQFDYTGFVGGTTRLKLTQGDLKKIPFPLPPLAEQERIVAKLDKLFAQYVKIKAALERIPQLLKTFRQQVLTQAVTGKLTEQWREGKDLEEWKEVLDDQLKIKHELIKSKQLNGKSYGSIKDTERDINLPNEWAWIRWNDILSFSNQSMKRGPFGSALKKEFFVESGVRVFEQYNPINDDPYFQRYYVTHEKFEELKSFKATSGDLLISCSGVTLGRITEIPNDTDFGIINQALLKLTLNFRLISNEYFIKLFRSEYIQKKIFDNAKGSAIPNMVGVDELKKMPLPIPALYEQQEIVRRVENFFAKSNAIEKRYQTIKAKVDKLPQAILHKAFKGELVPQLPTDGDAKDLLVEIMELKKEATGKGSN